MLLLKQTWKNEYLQILNLMKYSNLSIMYTHSCKNWLTLHAFPTLSRSRGTLLYYILLIRNKEQTTGFIWHFFIQNIRNTFVWFYYIMVNSLWSKATESIYTMWFAFPLWMTWILSKIYIKKALYECLIRYDITELILNESLKRKKKRSKNY